MGAPGHYVLCPKGHEIGVIEDDLYWDEDMFKKLEDLENKNVRYVDRRQNITFAIIDLSMIVQMSN